jgi:zinc protease
LVPLRSSNTSRAATLVLTDGDDVIEQTDFEGIRLLTGQAEGPVQACLLFGVGARDEDLRNHGISHIVEHLTLSGLGNQAYEYNGSVNATHTRFVAMGSPDDIATFLQHVTTTLAALPESRLADEINVLRVESSRRRTDQLGADLSARFGARGPGLMAWPEFALNSTEFEPVRAWAQRWFIRSNAVLWLSRPLPDLAPLTLPEGPDVAHPPVPEDRITGRVWNPAETDLVSLSYVRAAGDTIAVGTFGLAAVRERTTDALRAKSAVTYSVRADQVHVGDEHWVCMISADGSAPSYLEVLNQLTETIGAVAADGPTDEELTRAKGRYRTMSTVPQAVMGLLDSNAMRLLDGKPLLQAEDFVNAADRVTAAEVAAALLPTLGSMLAIGPRSLGQALPGWHSRQIWSTESATGETFEPVPGMERGTLVIGETGVAWYMHQSSWRLIRWDECAACVTWANGARQVFSADGRSVFIYPWAWKGGDRLPAIVDQYAPPLMRVTGDPARAPKPPDPPAPPPPSPAGDPAAARLKKERRAWRILWATAGVMYVIGVIVSLVTWSFLPLFIAVALVVYARYRMRAQLTGRGRANAWKFPGPPA